MSNPLKVALSLVLLAAIGSTGCEKESTTTIEVEAGQVVTEVEANMTVSESAEPQTSPDNAEGADKKPKDLAAMLRENLKPEIIGPALEEGFAKVQESFAAITDEASATEALPKFEEFYRKVSQMSSMVPLVPPESRPVILETLSAATGPLQTALDKLYENEAVKEKLQPISDKIMEKLAQVSEKLQPKPAAESASEEEGESTPEADEAPADEAEAAAAE